MQPFVRQFELRLQQEVPGITVPYWDWIAQPSIPPQLSVPSLLSKWDKTGKDDEQFLKAYRWDGKRLSPLFHVDFRAENLGRPHIMRFGQDRFYKNQIFEGS